jgi:hypothetical protein
MQILFANDQQAKSGLDASELNQRAIAKVVEATVSAVYNGKIGVIKPADGEDGLVDWKHYYELVSEEMKAEKLSQYKIALGQMAKKADMVEAMLPKFEERIKGELDRAAASANGDKAKAADKFVNDVRAQIALVRMAHNEATNPEAEIQIREFADTDTLFNYVIGMHRRMEAEEKKIAEAKKLAEPSEAPAIVAATESDVRVFGG